MNEQPGPLPSHPLLLAEGTARDNIVLYHQSDPVLWGQLRPVLDDLQAGVRPFMTTTYATRPTRYYVQLPVPGRDQVCVLGWVVPKGHLPVIAACKLMNP